MKNVGIVKVENKALLGAIMSEDSGNFWESDKYMMIVKEIEQNGVLRRHPVYTDYVVDIVSGTIYRTRGKVIRLSISEQRGYESVSIRKGKKDYANMYLSRLVMEAFLGVPLASGYDVHHYEYVPAKNSIYNIRYTTHAQNCKIRHTQNPIRRPRYWYLIQRDGVTVYIGKSERDAANFLGVAKSTVNGCCSGKQKTIAGYTIKREVR